MTAPACRRPGRTGGGQDGKSRLSWHFPPAVVQRGELRAWPCRSRSA